MKKFAIGVLAAAGCLAFLTSPASAASKTTECTGTLTGTYGKVVVPDGATCMLDGAVTGKVTVGAGSSLYTNAATINGNLMSRDAATVRVIDTDVLHNIKVTGTTGTTKIGGKGCKVDPMSARNLMLSHNLGSVAVCDMAVGNNLKVKANEGRVGLFRNTVDNNILVFDNTGLANRVRDNVAGGNLNCHGNTGKVLTSGNTAQQLMGQCTS